MTKAIMPEKPKPSTRRILSIDGGGIRGVFPAAFLATIEEHLDHPVGSYFDLIVGTSTGGILALGLAMGMPASKILALYMQHGPKIFGEQRTFGHRTRKLLRNVRWVYQSKYGSEDLKQALAEIFDNTRLGEAKTRLVIPTWDPQRHSPYIYKTAHHSRLEIDYKSLAVDVALATSAAPTYFPQHTTQEGVVLLDGGVWANNPTAVAAVEAIGVLEWPRTSLRILSLGCLEEIYTTPRHLSLASLFRKSLPISMKGQSQGAMGMARLLTGDAVGHQTVYRVNRQVPHKAYRMDDASLVKEIQSLGRTEGRTQLPLLKPDFFSSLAEDFSPVHQLKEVTNYD